MANNAKDNFNQAMFSMFGVGKETEAAGASEQVAYSPESRPNDGSSSVPPTMSTPPSNKPRTYIAEGTVLEGNLRSNGDVDVVGTLKGNLEAQGYVTVRSALNGNITAQALDVMNCTVTGDIHVAEQVFLDNDSCIIGNVFAKEFVCSGQVKGHLNIDNTLSLKESAVVEGNIATGRMEMAAGAVLSGKVEMSVPAVKKDF